jgi:hypothetical protein
LTLTLFLNILRISTSLSVRLALPLSPITPRAPSREGHLAQLSCESNHKLSVPWNSPDKAAFPRIIVFHPDHQLNRNDQLLSNQLIIDVNCLFLFKIYIIVYITVFIIEQLHFMKVYHSFYSLSSGLCSKIIVKGMSVSKRKRNYVHKVGVSVLILSALTQGSESLVLKLQNTLSSDD